MASKLRVFAHTSYIGTNGINAHFRNFFREMNSHCDLAVRTYTVGDSWKGYNKTPHEGEPYLTDVDRKMLSVQTLWTPDKQRRDYPIYNTTATFRDFDLNIVADIVDHYYYYDNYARPNVAYSVWESTRMPEQYFERLKWFNEVWVPSHWQKDCMVAQGMDPDFIKIVPGGVEANVFFPEEVEFDEHYKDGRFKFVVFGRWDYRKATKEIIETFLKTFSKDEPVDLVISVDNGFPADGMKTTEERLKHFGFEDSRIKVLHFVKREDYIKFIKKGHVFLSCSRGEGVNLPLMEALASGTPAIYSKCSGQLEFTEGLGHPVSVSRLCSSNTGDGGSYSEPDFDELGRVMRDVYTNYQVYKTRAVKDSSIIRSRYDWKVIGKLGYDTASALVNRLKEPPNAKKQKLKVMFVVPHLSTGGMPQFLLRRIEEIKDECKVYCVEHEQIATWYVVQRDKIVSLLGDRFYSLTGEPKEKLLELIDTIKPDVVHFEEFPETFVSKSILPQIYRKSRNYLIMESYHGLWFKPEEKMVFPDKFLFVSEFQSEIYRDRFEVPYEIVEYPIDDLTPNKELYQKELGLDPSFKHVLNVGLFTPGKNQGELIQYAKSMKGLPVKFHFVGNQAPNFEDYWGPLMKDLPDNCVVWGERNDTHKFYQACDLMAFTSVMETSPLVIREAISWKLPVLIHNLPSYKNMYTKYSSVKYLTKSADENINLIKKELHLL